MCSTAVALWFWIRGLAALSVDFPVMVTGTATGDLLELCFGKVI